MMRHTPPWFSTVCIAAAGLHAGCGAPKEFRTAQLAEIRGEDHVAYDLYVQAATRNPGHGPTAAGLARVGPNAARYWESQGHLAEQDGRYDDAWRAYMRGLEIRPDHPSLPQLIRRLESTQPDRIVQARSEWLERGSTALALAKTREPDVTPRTPPREARPVAVATLTEKPAPTTEVRPSPVVQAKPREREPGHSAVAMRTPKEPVNAAAASNPPSADAPRTAAPVLARQPARQVAPAGTAMTEVTPAGSPAASRERRDQSSAARRDPRLEPRPPAPASTDLPPITRRSPGPSGPPRHADAAPPRRPALIDSEYLVRHTLSRKDRRYPRESELIDGIWIKLRDTDDDVDADLDLHHGSRRIAKIRTMKPGQSRVFTGRSGRSFRLVLLSVHHPTRTVRIAVRPVS